ncbi:hypothetical protein ACFVXQ_10565 [Kitasatospora sp. NPDC058263]
MSDPTAPAPAVRPIEPAVHLALLERDDAGRPPPPGGVRNGGAPPPGWPNPAPPAAPLPDV